MEKDLGAQGALNSIAAQLAAGRTVTMGFLLPPTDVPLLDGHAYMVDRVNRDNAGNVVSVVVRNPWGFDGYWDDGNDDGYLTVTADVLNRGGDWLVESCKFA